MPEIEAGFRQPFAEQQAALRLRLANLLPTQAWDDLRHNAHDKAFVVAGAMKADLLADLATAIEKAVSQGTTLEEFRRDFRQIVARHGWTGWAGEGSAKGEAWRTRVIYRTNMLTSYASGRRAQLIAGKYPIWVYKHSGAEHPRLHHLAWDGVALPVNHPFWATHSPPNGWGCGCEIYGARSEAGVRRVGGDPTKALPDGWQMRDQDGALSGIDKGWDYAPGATASASILTLKDKLPALPAQIGSRMFAAWPNSGPSLDAEFSKFVNKARSEFIQGRSMVVGALKPHWVDQANKHGVQPQTAEIVVGDEDVHHAFDGSIHITAPSTKPRGRKSHHVPVDLDWYKSIPSHLQNPDRILLDTTDPSAPAFLLIYDLPSQVAKLVVRVNCKPRRTKGTIAFNKVRTSMLLNPGDVQSLIGRGVIELQKV